MSALPYFQWYPSDAETDENFRAMTDEEIGFYIRCLNHAWLNNGLPVDAAERALVLRTQQRIADKCWIRVGKCFTEENGRMVNVRQEKERTKAKRKSEQATNSIRTRYERSSNVPLRASESESDSDVSSKGVQGGLYYLTLKLIERHPRKGEDRKIPGLLDRLALDDPRFDPALVDRRHAEFVRRLDSPKFAGRLSKWLEDGGWLDETLDGAQYAEVPVVSDEEFRKWQEDNAAWEAKRAAGELDEA